MPTSRQPLVLVVDDYADATEVWSLYLRATGFEVERALRADEHASAIPLIAATGCADRRELDVAREYFQLIVTKPCDPADLVTQIRRLLAARPE
jgi:CheY-like chemotaxis protein